MSEQNETQALIEAVEDGWRRAESESRSANRDWGTSEVDSNIIDGRKAWDAVKADLAALQAENKRLRDENAQLEAAIKEAFEQVYASYDSDTPYKDACMSVSDAFNPLGFHLTAIDDGRDICVRVATAPADAAEGAE